MALDAQTPIDASPARPTPTWVWLIQRISGVLLAPLVVIHILVAQAPFTVWLTSLMLAVILAHAYVGLWRIVSMRQVRAVAARAAAAVAVGVIAIVLVFGIALLWSLA